MITDGKPSALTLPNGQVTSIQRDSIPGSAAATYREVGHCRRSGIMINTFMLARDQALVEFVKQVATICRGKATASRTP